ncbi:hypothetical protein F5887DRAFT_1190560 [Amanita rubescens]|nr:hypothetical protein F5887DRAFT_1190560 [Amanita rubescens]
MIFNLFSRKPRQSLEQAEPEPQTQPDNDQDMAFSDLPQQLPPPSPPPPQVSDPSPLYSLIRSVPPQVFHAYSLDRLELEAPEPPSPTTLTKLTSFFSTLVPPPKLHCVRCHKSFFGVENTDRSCLVPHDDDSAEVERISLSKAKDLNLASEYETLWGCCGRTVEGDGDMGPPDGWCYEGKHTTDIKRARFRADSTPNDDKLVSCSRLRCPGTLLSPTPSSVTHTTRAPRKRVRTNDETDAEDPMSQTDAENEKRVRKRRRTKSTSSRRKSGGDVVPAEPKDESKEEEKMDVDMPAPTPKPRRMRKPRKSMTDGNDSSSSSPPSTKQRPTPKSIQRRRPSSEKPSSPGGTRVVQRLAYVDVPKRPLSRMSQSQKTVMDTDKEENDHCPQAQPQSDAQPQTRTPGATTRARAKALVEIVETSVDAERVQ